MNIKDVIDEICSIKSIIVTSIEIQREIIEANRKNCDYLFKEKHVGYNINIIVTYVLREKDCYLDTITELYQIERNTAQVQIYVIHIDKGSVTFRIVTREDSMLNYERRDEEDENETKT